MCRSFLLQLSSFANDLRQYRKSQSERLTFQRELDEKMHDVEKLSEDLSRSAAENERLGAQSKRLEESLKKSLEEADTDTPAPQGCKCAVQ